MPPLIAFAPSFEREQGCTEADWQRCLPGAVEAAQSVLATVDTPSRHARIALAGGGGLTLQWTPLPERRIALIRLPRLQVAYRFDDGVDAGTRAAFMQRFDLYLHRGGG
jgi:hypothetical protein